MVLACVLNYLPAIEYRKSRHVPHIIFPFSMVGILSPLDAPAALPIEPSQPLRSFVKEIPRARR